MTMTEMKRNMFGFASEFATRSGCVETLMDAAGAKITRTVTRCNDYIPGQCAVETEEIDTHTYAEETDVGDVVSINGRSAAITTTFVDGVGGVVTQTITHKGDITITRDYEIDVDPESDAYDGAYARQAISAIRAHDRYHEDYIRLILEAEAEDGLTVTESAEARHTTTCDPHITYRQLEAPIDKVARMMAMNVDTDGVDGITGVIKLYDPGRQTPDRWFLPVGVCVREETFYMPRRRVETTYWTHEFELVNDRVPTDPREYAAFCGAREY